MRENYRDVPQHSSAANLSCISELFTEKKKQDGRNNDGNNEDRSGNEEREERGERICMI